MPCSPSLSEIDEKMYSTVHCKKRAEWSLRSLIKASTSASVMAFREQKILSTLCQSSLASCQILREHCGIFYKAPVMFE